MPVVKEQDIVRMVKAKWKIGLVRDSNNPVPPVREYLMSLKQQHVIDDASLTLHTHTNPLTCTITIIFPQNRTTAFEC